MRKDSGDSPPKDGGGLGAVIQKAKERKRVDRFDTFVGSILKLWYYQYLENFHSKPETVEDMVDGMKYLIYSRTDK